MATESKTAVIAAILGDIAVVLAKALAVAFTGSSAMLSEAIHSLVDTMNDGLILYGMHRSRKRPDIAHPFGYGRELYFWTTMVGILIFAIGGGMSIYEGVMQVLHPSPVANPAWSYAVLGFSVPFEGASWYYGWKAFRSEQRGRGILRTIHESKDPVTFSVLLGNSAAVVGLLLAFAGIFAGHLFRMPSLDGIAAVAIGILLCIMSGITVYESQSLLVGEGVGKETLEGIREIVGSDTAVEHCGRLLTVYLGPDEVLLTIEIRFRPENSAVAIRHAVARLKKAIQARYKKIRRIYFDADALTEAPHKRSKQNA